MSEQVRMRIQELCHDVSLLQDRDGLFPTFRIEHERVVNDAIPVDHAKMIETSYDHSFILNLLFSLRKQGFVVGDDVLRKGVQWVIDDAIPVSRNGEETVRWRYYNIDHQGMGKILPDIDTTGRNLLLLLSSMGGSQQTAPITFSPSLVQQFWETKTAVDPEFHPTESPGVGTALLTHFGNKEGNDVDPVCNLVALAGIARFFTHFPVHANTDEKMVRGITDFLMKFLHSDHCGVSTHEYYEPIVVLYVYAKWFDVMKHSPFRSFVDAQAREQIHRLTKGCVKTARNPLERSFVLTTLLRTGEEGAVVDDLARGLMKEREWGAYRFYRQRHPHRIFGSQALTRTAGAEALSLWLRTRSEA